MCFSDVFLLLSVNVSLHMHSRARVNVLLQDSEAASCKMNSLGSNHSIPSTSVSTGSQSSSVNSIQEVLDDSCPDMQPQDYSTPLDSTAHTKKVKVRGEGGG